MNNITVIDLQRYVIECVICGRTSEQPPSAPSFGVARYEDEVVPDNYKGEWGGGPVCPTCYWIERGIHSSESDAFIPFSRIRDLSTATR
jgi:hypothetical protein